jgi:hypothetical protein
MFQDKPEWIAHQRRRFTRPDGERYIRPDAYRFMPPGAPRCVGKDVLRYCEPGRADRKNNRLACVDDDTDLRGLSVERDALVRLRSELSAIKAELKFWRLLRNSKAYNPNQPRVPAGNPDGGQWTSDGGSLTAPRTRLAGPLPTDDPPELPKEKPQTAKERTRIIRQLAKRRSPIGLLIEAIPWLRERSAEIQASFDPPKSLEELQRAASTPAPGYDIHHIVERGPAEREGLPREQIESLDNKVRIPRLKHWDINTWYGTKNEDFGNLSPRDYLRGKSWEERRQVGFDALVRFGVLRP